MNHFRTYRSLMNHNSKHMANMLFFECLRLTFLYKVYETSSKASEYAKQSVIRPMSSAFSMRDTDIKGILVYFRDIENYPKKTKNDEIFLNRIEIDNQKIINYLRRMMIKQDIGSHSTILLKSLQRDLHIDDPKLRAMLTLVLKWDTLSSDDMKLLVERIKNYGLLHMRHSQLSKVMNQFVKQNPNYGDDSEKKDNKITPMDVMLGALSGLAAKWAYDSRKKNQQSFSRLKDNNDKKS